MIPITDLDPFCLTVNCSSKCVRPVPPVLVQRQSSVCQCLQPLLCYFLLAWPADGACWFWQLQSLSPVGTVQNCSGHTTSCRLPPSHSTTPRSAYPWQSWVDGLCHNLAARIISRFLICSGGSKDFPCTVGRNAAHYCEHKKTAMRG